MHKDHANHDRRIRAGQTDEYTCLIHPGVARYPDGARDRAWRHDG